MKGKEECVHTVSAGLEFSNEGWKRTHTLSLLHSLAHTRFTLIWCQVCRLSRHSRDWVSLTSSNCLCSFYQATTERQFTEIAPDIHRENCGTQSFDSQPSPTAEDCVLPKMLGFLKHIHFQSLLNTLLGNCLSFDCKKQSNELEETQTRFTVTPGCELFNKLIKDVVR